jgi:hypothetical protein
LKYGRILLAVVVGCGALLLASIFDRPDTTQIEMLKQLAAEEAHAEAAREPPVLPEPAPFDPARPPKAVAGKREVTFGVMAIGAEHEHEFIIRNVGQSPLRLSKGKTTCKCTIANLSETGIAPGEAAPIHVTVRPVKQDASFRQTATIHTNDPQNPSIQFVVSGRVEPRISVEPGWMWSAGDVRTHKPVTVTGIIYSVVESDFKVLELSAKPSASKTVVSPMHRIAQERLREGPTSKDLAERMNAPPARTQINPLPVEKLQSLGAKAGYELVVEFTPSSVLGPFREDVSIQTNLEGGEVLNCTIVGRRVPPFTILPPAGVQWNESRGTLDLGRFAARDGKQVRLSLVFFDAQESTIELTDVACNPPSLRCSLSVDPKGSAERRNRYVLTLEVPAGEIPATFNRERPATVTLQTNHPNLGKLELRIVYASLE